MTPGRRWWLGVALLLSLGVNLGLLASMAGHWWAAPGHGDEGHQVIEDPRPAPGDLPPEPMASGDRAADWEPGEEGMSTRPGDEEFRRHMPPLGRMADHLGLEGEKRQSFLRLQREVFTRMARSRVLRRALTRDLYVELAAPEPDQGRVEELLDELSRLYTETERLTATGILESRALLDEDEQRRYLEILRRMHRHGGRRGPGAGPGHGPAGEGGPHPGRRHHRP